jgi:hypothetical protein
MQNLRDVGGMKAVLMAGGERAQQDWQREVQPAVYSISKT